MYLWVVIIGGIFSFFTSAGIGANDAANAFATSVGSKALTIKQATFLAAIFETSGAILMGSHVTNTIRKGIANYECFDGNEYLLMYGCMWVIFSVGIWLFFASYLEMPVSTTHSCVGGMIGMAWLLKGVDCVIWVKYVDTFPYLSGVSGIILSWVLSPLFSCLLSSLLFYILRKYVLRQNFYSMRINFAYTILIGITIMINVFFITYKGAKGIGLDKTPLYIAFIIGTFCSCIISPYIPKLKAKVNSTHSNISINNNENDFQIDFIKNKNELDKVNQIHNDAEKFDPKIEEIFKYLQVFSAVCDSFSHGANDVANGIGPFAVIYSIYS